MSETLDIIEDHPPKKKHLISIDEDDINCLKGEMNDIKVFIEEIVEHLRDVDHKLVDILDELKQLS